MKHEILKKEENHSSFWNTVLTGRLTGQLLKQWVSCDLQTNVNTHVCFHPGFGETRAVSHSRWQEALCDHRHKEMDRRLIREQRTRMIKATAQGLFMTHQDDRDRG